MLPKKNRLDLKKEFSFLKRRGKLVKGRFFNFLFLKETPPSFSSSAFAFIVSKKVEKKATKRNRIKRLLREGVRSLLPLFSTEIKGVFLAKREISGKNLTEIKNELESIFKKENLI